MIKNDSLTINKNELYQQTISMMPINIYWKDINLNYIGCNMSQARNFGLNSPQEIISKNDYDFFSKENADILKHNDTMVLSDGKPRMFEEKGIDTEDGPIYYLTQKIPLRNNKGEIIGLAGISFNITDQEKKKQIEIEKSEDVLSNILGHLPGHIYWKDTNSVYQGCNILQAQSAGFHDQQDIIGKTDFDMPWHDTAKEIHEMDLSVIKTKEMITKEEVWHTQEKNKTLVFLSKKTPLLNKKGKVIGVLGISFDITDRKKMEEDLVIAKEAAEAANRAKTIFIKNISHDMRTPLTGMMNISEGIEEAIKEPEIKTDVKLFHASSEQLLNLLEEVLESAAADVMTEDTLIKKPFDFRKVIQDVMELEGSAIKTVGLSIEAHIDKNIPQYLIGDKSKFHRIFLNLVGNAIKFTPKGYIELNARLLTTKNNTIEIEFSVKDTGIGIADEHKDKVFDQFYKVSPSYKGVYKGYGIGLHLVNTFIKLMHGKKPKVSGNPGVGTTISFVLPMQIGQQPENTDELPTESTHKPDIVLVKKIPKANTTAVNAPMDADKIQVLLVEDNPSALIGLTYLIKPFDVQISTAIDAELAFELVKTRHFGLIITDLGLPCHSGDELTVMIRALEKEHQQPPTTIVGLTGHLLDDIKDTCLSAGMNKVYKKPISSDELKTLIDSLTLKGGVEASPLSSPPHGALGVDLPDTEAELFEINQYPILDLQVGIKILQSEEVVREVLKCMLDKDFADDVIHIKEAHHQGNWKTVEKLAHKTKGGACYGTVQLYYATMYMERYIKAGHTQCLEELYAQMLQVIDESVMGVKNWLK